MVVEGACTKVTSVTFEIAMFRSRVSEDSTKLSVSMLRILSWPDVLAFQMQGTFVCLFAAAARHS